MIVANPSLVSLKALSKISNCKFELHLDNLVKSLSVIFVAPERLIAIVDKSELVVMTLRHSSVATRLHCESLRILPERISTGTSSYSKESLPINFSRAANADGITS